MPLNNDLKKILKGEVLDDEATKAKYSHDASLFEITPEAVVFPKDTEDLKKLIKFANENKNISLTPRSGGTDMTGAPLSESVVLDFTKYFNKIIEVGVQNAESGHAVVEPGVFYRDFEKETLKHGLILPTYPASREICAVGGMVANNAGGEKTLAYGKTENYVMELHTVLSDGEEHVLRPLNEDELLMKRRRGDLEGEIYRKMYDLAKYNFDLLQKAEPNVSKNSAGYNLWDIWDGKIFDLTKLFVGSQGTLGVITKIKFRLVKPKPYSRLTVIFLKDLNLLLEIIRIVMKFQPESFESFDDHTLKLAMRFLPDLIKILKPKNLIKLGLSFLPEAWMTLTGGFPKLILLVELADNNEKNLENRLQDLKRNLKSLQIKFRISPNEEDAKKYWTMRRESFNLLRKHVRGKRTAPFIDDFIVRVEDLPEFLPRLNKILDRYELTYTIAGHVGDGNFHIIPLMDLADPKSAEIIRGLSDEVYNLVLEYGGSITAEHNDGLIRSPFLKKMYGEKVYKLFEETKHIFDPKNIFNPGKKVGASLKYAFEHLVRE
ncbi:MAG: FAD-binding oxidoreductase [Candidatus Harrisonbacteria bacterium]|nr:FAD-binding oxidoreductase [Candidatus Harrisonbacteria bacterium]